MTSMRTADEDAHVVVNSVAGEELYSFRPRRDSTWRDFIAAIENARRTELDDGHVLIHGTSVLGGRTDSDFHEHRMKPILAASSVMEPVQLTLVLQQRPKVREAIACLQREKERCPLRAERALETLAREARHGDSEATEAVRECLTSGREWVRLQAVRALAQITERGDGLAIEAVLPLLGDANYWVRIEAMRALGQIAEPGDERVLEGLASLLIEIEGKVVLEALRAIRQIAKKGDRRAIEAVTPLLHYRHSWSPKQAAAVRAAGQNAEGAVRFEAVRTFGEIAEEGNRRAIEALAMQSKQFAEAGPWQPPDVPLVAPTGRRRLGQPPGGDDAIPDVPLVAPTGRRRLGRAK